MFKHIYFTFYINFSESAATYNIDLDVTDGGV